MKKIFPLTVFLLVFAGAAVIVLFMTNNESKRSSQTAPLVAASLNLKRSLSAIGQIPLALDPKLKPVNLKQEAPRRQDGTVTRENRNGRDYIPISVFELYDLCDTGSIKSFQKNAFVLRGVVLKDEMPGNGQLGLFRATQWCCKGHEVAWGFRLKGDVLETIGARRWVKVYCSIQGVAPLELAVKVSTHLAPTSMLRNDYQLIVDHMETTSIPEGIYTTYWNRKEPFYY